MSFRLIVGLGNPGKPYEGTRHNIGFRVIDAFARERSASPWKENRSLEAECAAVDSGSGKLLLAKPSTYMNESGRSVAKVCSYYKIAPEHMVVLYDEINLDVGQIKLSLSGSAGGHNGVESILSHLPPRFARLRIGVGAKPHKEMDLADHVLGKFTAEEATLMDASLERCLDCLERLRRDGPEKAMIHINRKTKHHD